MALDDCHCGRMGVLLAVDLWCECEFDQVQHLQLPHPQEVDSYCTLWRSQICVQQDYGDVRVWHVLNLWHIWSLYTRDGVCTRLNKRDALPANKRSA